MVRTRERSKILEETHPAFCQLQEYLEREGVPVMNDGDFKIDTVNENPLSATLLRNILHEDTHDGHRGFINSYDWMRSKK